METEKKDHLPVLAESALPASAEEVAWHEPVQRDVVRNIRKWKQPPGNSDVTHIGLQFYSDNSWGIPALHPVQVRPERLVSWAERLKPQKPGDALHMYADDYRIEPIWNRPYQILPLVQRFGVSLTPDYSLFLDAPKATQIYNTYRNRWVGAFWQHHGITVVPTLCWGEPSTWDFCFAGIQPGGVVSCSTVTARRTDHLMEIFQVGFLAMLERVRPSGVLLYGDPSIVPHIPEGVWLQGYGIHWDQVWSDLKEKGRSLKRGKYTKRPDSAQAKAKAEAAKLREGLKLLEMEEKKSGLGGT